MSVEVKAATEKRCETCSYYWQIGKDEQGLEVHVRTARQNSFCSIATVSTIICGILSVLAVSRNAVC